MGKSQQTDQAVPTAASKPAPEYELVVTQSFPGYSVGEIVTDSAKIIDLIDSEWASHFVKKARTAQAEEATS